MPSWQAHASQLRSPTEPHPSSSTPNQPPQVFTQLHTLVLSTLNCATTADPAFALPTAANYLSAIRTLKRLVLQDLPVLPPNHPAASQWQLGGLRSLRGLNTLDLRLR